MSDKMVPFCDLALGTRFRHIHSDKEWVKIGHNLIAEWDESQKTARWIGQQLCCFDDNDNLSTVVYI
jgi:hypothetical protein